MTKVKIDTAKGVMIAELYDNETPITVDNFKKLINEEFYNGLNFHRVIPNFMIQGGCPNGVGNGGPGYTIKCEVNADKQYHDRGVLSMAHAGRDTGGSQFFICTTMAPWLDGRYVVFGDVSEGMEVVRAIESVGSTDGKTSKKVIITNCGQL